MMKAMIFGAAILATATAAQANDSAALAGAEAQQAYHAMVAFVATRVATRPTDSVVLAADAPLVKGNFVPCAAKPLAVIVALDSAVRGDAAVPGAGHAIGEARKAGVAVVFTTDRPASDAAAIGATLTTLKLGPAVAGDTLLTGGGGDVRRAAIAGKYCVIAAAGSRLSDFSDKFAAEHSENLL